MGTGVKLSDRFKGLTPTAATAVQEPASSGATPVHDLLKLLSLEISIDAKNKAKNRKGQTLERNYHSSCLHKLFAQRQACRGKIKKAAPSKVLSEKEKKKEAVSGLIKKPEQSVGTTEQNGTTKQTNMSDNVQKPLENPRDPRLLYGRRSKEIAAKKTPIPPVTPKPNAVAHRQRKSFLEAINDSDKKEIDVPGIKGGKTIQVVKRNAVTKKITGIVQLNVQRKPPQSTEVNNPVQKKVLLGSAGTKKGSGDGQKPLRGILKKSTSLLSCPTENVNTEKAVSKVKSASVSGSGDIAVIKPMGADMTHGTTDAKNKRTVCSAKSATGPKPCTAAVIKTVRTEGTNEITDATTEKIDKPEPVSRLVDTAECKQVEGEGAHERTDVNTEKAPSSVLPVVPGKPIKTILKKSSILPSKQTEDVNSEKAINRTNPASVSKPGDAVVSQTGVAEVANEKPAAKEKGISKVNGKRTGVSAKSKVSMKAGKLVKKKSALKAKIKKSQGPTPIVLQLSIVPSVDNGTVNWKVVSSSEGEHEECKSQESSTEGAPSVGIGQTPKVSEGLTNTSLEQAVNAALEKEFKKGSPIAVRISNTNVRGPQRGNSGEKTGGEAMKKTVEEGSPIAVRISNTTARSRAGKAITSTNVSSYTPAMNNGFQTNTATYGSHVCTNTAAVPSPGYVYTTAGSVPQFGYPVLSPGGETQAPYAFCYGDPINSSNGLVPYVPQTQTDSSYFGYGSATNYEEFPAFYHPSMNYQDVPIGGDGWSQPLPSRESVPFSQSDPRSSQWQKPYIPGASLEQPIPPGTESDSGMGISTSSRLAASTNTQQGGPISPPIVSSKSVGGGITDKPTSTAQTRVSLPPAIVPANYGIANATCSLSSEDDMPTGTNVPVTQSNQKLVSSMSKKLDEKILQQNKACDNFSVVDMDICSSPCKAIPVLIKRNEQVSESTAQKDKNLLAHPGEVRTVLTEQTLDVRASKEGVSSPVNHLTESHNKIISHKLGISEEAVGSAAELQIDEKDVLQYENWTTYIEEETNSPIKSAFGSKQSFSEAVTSLQSAMATASVDENTPLMQNHVDTTRSTDSALKTCEANLEGSSQNQSVLKSGNAVRHPEIHSKEQEQIVSDTVSSDTCTAKQDDAGLLTSIEAAEIPANVSGASGTVSSGRESEEHDTHTGTCAEASTMVDNNTPVLLRKLSQPGTPVRDERDDDIVTTITGVCWADETSTHEHSTSVGSQELNHVQRQPSRSQERPNSGLKLSGPTYLRQLSNVSDTSLAGEDLKINEQYGSDEALKPLLVRGTSTGVQDFEQWHDNMPPQESNFWERRHRDKDLSPSIAEKSNFQPTPLPRRKSFDRYEEMDSGKLRPRREGSMEMERRTCRYGEEEIYEQRPYDDGTAALQQRGHSFRRDDHHQVYDSPASSDQMTAVQALQIQIDAAVNPAHRAALIMALEALTSQSVQHPYEREQSEILTPEVQPPDFYSRERSSLISPAKPTEPRKVEFTVVVDEEAAEEHLRRRDALKKQQRDGFLHVEDDRAVEGTTYFQREPYHFHRKNDGPHGDHVKCSSASGQKVKLARERTEHEHTEEGHANHKPKQRPESVSGMQKHKETSRRKSKRKAKQFHGRPLIKDKTNATNPHPIPLQADSEQCARIDPRRSITPEPKCQSYLEPLKWKHNGGPQKKMKIKSVIVGVKPADKQDINDSSSGAPQVQSDGVDNALKQTLMGSACKESAAAKEHKIETEDEVVIAEENEGGVEMSPFRDDGIICDEPEEIEDTAVACIVHEGIEKLVSAARIASDQGKEGDVSTLEGAEKEEPSSPVSKSKGKATTPMKEDTAGLSVQDGTPITPVKKNGKVISSGESRHSHSRTTPEGSKKESHKLTSRDKDKSSKVSPHRSPSKRNGSHKSSSHSRRRSSGESSEERRHRPRRRYSADSDSERSHSKDSTSKVFRRGHLMRFSKKDGWGLRDTNFSFSYNHARQFPSFMRGRGRGRGWGRGKPGYIFPGNLGKPYSQTWRGNSRGVGSFKGRGRGGRPFVRSWKQDYSGPSPREGSPKKSMSDLGFGKVVPWDEVQASLDEVKSQLLALEQDTDGDKRATAALQIPPLLMAQQSTESALKCIHAAVIKLSQYDRHQIYLHRQKYEILMADIRIHAEALAEILPEGEGNTLLSHFEDNTTGIPYVRPFIELKVLGYLQQRQCSSTPLTSRERLLKKIQELKSFSKTTLFKFGPKESKKDKEPSAKESPSSNYSSDEHRSPDTTHPDSDFEKELFPSPEVVSCPEMGFASPDAPSQFPVSGLSDMCRPTVYPTARSKGEQSSKSLKFFRDPPQPVRKLMSSSEDNVRHIDLSMAVCSSDNVVFESLDDPVTRDTMTERQTEQDSAVSVATSVKEEGFREGTPSDGHVGAHLDKRKDGPGASSATQGRFRRARSSGKDCSNNRKSAVTDISSYKKLTRSDSLPPSTASFRIMPFKVKRVRRLSHTNLDLMYNEYDESCEPEPESPEKKVQKLAIALGQPDSTVPDSQTPPPLMEQQKDAMETQ